MTKKQLYSPLSLSLSLSLFSTVLITSLSCYQYLAPPPKQHLKDVDLTKYTNNIPSYTLSIPGVHNKEECESPTL